MTARERADLRRAMRLIWDEDSPDEGWRILARLAEMTIPALEIAGRPVAIWELVNAPGREVELQEPPP